MPARRWNRTLQAAGKIVETGVKSASGFTPSETKLATYILGDLLAIFRSGIEQEPAMTPEQYLDAVRDHINDIVQQAAEAKIPRSNKNGTLNVDTESRR